MRRNSMKIKWRRMLNALKQAECIPGKRNPSELSGTSKPVGQGKVGRRTRRCCRLDAKKMHRLSPFGQRATFTTGGSTGSRCTDTLWHLFADFYGDGRLWWRSRRKWAQSRRRRVVQPVVMATRFRTLWIVRSTWNFHRIKRTVWMTCKSNFNSIGWLEAEQEFFENEWNEPVNSVTTWL